ncbi:MAG: 6,7-dimethyl-8-ribityllumazine synthase, partial [Planctomycetes bacterium]|nr:6,7-dimethyl-8-ribityllumazine synthase [Planctomycetota bacterium]
MNNEFNTYQGELVAPEKAKIAIVISRFNELISSKLLGGAVDALGRLKFDMQNLDVFWVPGAFEIGIAAKNLVKKEKYDGILCLGAVIRGGTPHFDIIASESAKAIANIGIETGLPIIYSIIT